MIQEYLGKILVPCLRMLMHIFFRRIEIIGADNVPTDAPVIFTPNHPNSVIDGILAKTFLPRDPRPLGKATLWDNPLTRPLVIAANAIPVHRPQDASRSGQSLNNDQMFNACTLALKEKSCLVLFPEGTSHDEPELLPIKTGAARITLSAEESYGSLGVRIVPVGLIFDDKKSFRSRLLIYIGKPIDPMKGVKKPDPEDHELVNDITDRILEGIRSVTLNYPSWEDAGIIQRAADLYRSVQNKRSGDDNSLVDEFSIHKKMADTYPTMQEKHPREVSRVVNAVNSYDRLLRVLGIQHDHFMQGRPGIIGTISSLQKMSMFVVRLPLAIMGIFLNAIPYLLTRMIGTFKKISENRASTAMFFSSLFLFPLFWTLEANILSYGMMPAWFWWLLAPASGLTSIYFLEHHSQMLEEITTYIRLQSQSEIREEVEERLANVEREVTEYIEAAIDLTTPKSPADRKTPARKKTKPKSKKPAAKQATKKKAAAKKAAPKKPAN